MKDNVIRPGFSQSNLIITLEDLLDRAKKGEITSMVVVATDRAGEIGYNAASGDMDTAPTMMLIAELECAKHFLVSRVDP